MRKHGNYSKEFKLHCVKHFEVSGKSIEKIAKSLEVPPSTLNGWIKRSKESTEVLNKTEISKGEVSVESIQKRISELKKEINILEQAISILFKD